MHIKSAVGEGSNEVEGRAMRQTDFKVVIEKVTEHFFWVTFPLVFLVKVS